jgi:hypothetical protein
LLIIFQENIKENNLDVVALYIKNHDTFSTLSKLFNIGATTVKKILVDAGVYTPTKNKPKDTDKHYHLNVYTFNNEKYHFDIISITERTLVIQRDTHAEIEPTWLFEKSNHLEKAIQFVKEQTNE